MRTRLQNTSGFKGFLRFRGGGIGGVGLGSKRVFRDINAFPPHHLPPFLPPVVCWRLAGGSDHWPHVIFDLQEAFVRLLCTFIYSGHEVGWRPIHIYGRGGINDICRLAFKIGHEVGWHITSNEGRGGMRGIHRLAYWIWLQYAASLGGISEL